MDERLHKPAVELLRRAYLAAHEHANDDPPRNGMELIPVNVPLHVLRKILQVIEPEVQAARERAEQQMQIGTNRAAKKLEHVT
jgi:hypothetical protein